jgi:L-ascorbate metabolism protein UlaG (beta-lactamase superfamily)
MPSDGTWPSQNQRRFTVPDGVAFTWYGHATWGLQGLDDGVRVLIDPWLSGPTFPAALRDGLAADILVLTHGHVDHTGEIVEVAKRLGVPVLAPVELAGALAGHGVENTVGFNKGGTVEAGGVAFTMTNAIHTGSITIDGQPGGYAEPAGYVLAFSNGTRVYAAGDTAIHADMSLIGELYKPSAAILPIGDHYTMGPFQAAHACRLLGVSHVFPGHWGTFPLLTGTPDALQVELSNIGLDGVRVHSMAPGDTVA